MTARSVVATVAAIAGLAALLTRAIAEGFTQIERVLGTYTVEVPAVIPEWMDAP